MNPFALWAEIWLRSGQAMLEALQQPPAAKAREQTVGVLPSANAPEPAALKKARKPAVKAKAKRKRKARR